MSSVSYVLSFKTAASLPQLWRRSQGQIQTASPLVVGKRTKEERFERLGLRCGWGIMLSTSFVEYGQWLWNPVRMLKAMGGDGYCLMASSLPAIMVTPGLPTASRHTTGAVHSLALNTYFTSATGFGCGVRLSAIQFDPDFFCGFASSGCGSRSPGRGGCFPITRRWAPTSRCAKRTSPLDWLTLRSARFAAAPLALAAHNGQSTLTLLAAACSKVKVCC